LLLASEQFVKLARQLMKAKGRSEDFVLLVPGNPAYAGEAELQQIVENAIEELASRFLDYGK
jgi:hypothetical protein